MKRTIPLKEYISSQTMSCTMKLSYAKYLLQFFEEKVEERRQLYNEILLDTNASETLKLKARIELGEKEEIEPQINAIINDKILDLFSVGAVTRYLAKNFQDRSFEYLSNVIAKLDAAIKEEPNNAENYFVRGFCYSFVKDIYRNEEDWRKAFQLDPNNEHIKIYLATLLEGANNTEEAVKLIPSIVHSDRVFDYYIIFTLRASNYFKRKEYDKAIELYNELLLLDPENYKIRLSYALTMRKSYKFEEAISEYLCLVSVETVSSLVHAQMAQTYILKGDPYKSEFHIKTAIDKGYTDRDFILKVLDDIIYYNSARRVINGSLVELYEKWGQKSESAFEYLATVFLDHGHYDDFFRIYNEGIEKFPKNNILKIRRMHCSIKRNERDCKEKIEGVIAIKDLDKRAKGSLAVVLFDAGQYFGASKHRELGQKYYKLSIEYGFINAKTYYNLATSLKETENYSEAIHWLTKIKTDSENRYDVTRTLLSIAQKDAAYNAKIAQYLTNQTHFILEATMQIGKEIFQAICDGIAASTKLEDCVINIGLVDPYNSWLCKALAKNRSIGYLKMHWHDDVAIVLKEAKNIRSIYFDVMDITKFSTLVETFPNIISAHFKLMGQTEITKLNTESMKYCKTQMEEFTYAKRDVTPFKIITPLHYEMYIRRWSYCNALYGDLQKELFRSKLLTYKNIFRCNIYLWKAEHLTKMIRYIFVSANYPMPNEIYDVIFRNFSIKDAAKLCLKFLLCSKSGELSFDH